MTLEGVYFMITRYLHWPAECFCDYNTVECVADSSRYLLPNHSLHTDIITRWSFPGEKVGFERKGRGKRHEASSPSFSLITNPFICLQRTQHSVGIRTGLFPSCFISSLFNTFNSLLLCTISPNLNTKPINRDTKSPACPPCYSKGFHVQCLMKIGAQMVTSERAMNTHCSSV